MERKSPRRGNGTGSAIHRADDAQSHNKSRSKLQANPLMQARLQALLWASWLQGGIRP